MKSKLEAACGCNIGRVRINNEDNFYFDRKILPLENSGLEHTWYLKRHIFWKEETFGVFDGMGGEENGQVASFLAADSLRKYCSEKEKSSRPCQEFMEQVIACMNDAVCLESVGGNMGTTAAILRFQKEEVCVCNVGDSKIFCCYEGKLFQISRDHTDEEFLRKQGISGRKPKLTQNIGILPEEMILEPYIHKYSLEKGMQFLLCSDGLTDMVSQDMICRMMNEDLPLTELVEKLIAAAMEGGGVDNTTVIIVRIN